MRYAVDTKAAGSTRGPATMVDRVVRMRRNKAARQRRDICCVARILPDTTVERAQESPERGIRQRRGRGSCPDNPKQIGQKQGNGVAGEVGQPGRGNTIFLTITRSGQRNRAP